MALARLMKNITWIEEGGVPVVHPPRRVPFALLSAKKPLLKDELRKLQEIEIIASITGPTPWVSSMVTVKRPNGQLRICLDPKDLNRVVKRSHYPLPMMEELLPQQTKAKVVSTFDIKNGFWHIQLVEASSKLTTFNTSFWRYRWLHLPFRLSSALEVFQRQRRNYYCQSYIPLEKTQSQHSNRYSVSGLCQSI